MSTLYAKQARVYALIMRSLYFGNGLKCPRFLLAALLSFATLPVELVAHPDIELQIVGLSAQLEANPLNVDLLLKRGDLHRRHQDYQAAARDFEVVRQAEPDNTLLDFYSGQLLLETRQPGSATEHLARYLLSHPRHAKAWMLRAEAEIQLGRPGNASEFFNRAIQYSTKPSPSLYRQLILSILATGETAWGSAKQTANDGLARFGLEVSLLGLGTDIALAMNQVEQAQQYLDQLPDGLRRLKQWQTRIQIANCMTASTESARNDCAHKARASLTDQIDVYMGGG